MLGIKGLASTHTDRSHSMAVTQQWLNIPRPVAIRVLAVPKFSVRDLKFGVRIL